MEQTFGNLKRRFQCLHHEMATERHQGEVYVVACAVLHNIGIKRGDIFANVDDDDGVRLVGRNSGVLRKQHINQFLLICLNVGKT